MTDPAEIRGKRLRWCDTHKQPAWDYADGSVQCMHDLIVEMNSDHVLGVFLADPAPVGLTEDEREVVEVAATLGPTGLDSSPYLTGKLLAIIDRLSAAPVDDRERVPEGWRVEWRTEEPHGPREGPREIPYLAQIPMAVSPSVDPEEKP